MKKLFKSFLLVAALMSLTACPNVDKKKDNEDKNVTSITLDTTSITLEKGASFEITASMEILDGAKYSGAITWATSNPNICAISPNDDSCTVVAVDSGTAYISAIAGYKIATCTINVPSTQVDTTVFEINKSTVSLKPGSTTQLSATLDGSEVRATWLSTNVGVATVNENGLITAISKGTSIVTATYEGKKASCVVTVSEEAQEEFTIALSSTSLSMTVGSSETLVATTNKPADVIWTSSNESVATVKGGVVSAKKVGSAVITAVANNISASCTVAVKEVTDEDKDVTIYFFLDYNNVDEEDTTGTKLLAKFNWYQNVPLASCPDVPKNPTTPSDPAFPYFVGWSNHTIIDSKDDLWDMEKDIVGSSYHLYLYGIWSDVEGFNL